MKWEGENTEIQMEETEDEWFLQVQYAKTKRRWLSLNIKDKK